MTVLYRGHEISVERGDCLAGYDLLYFSIFRQSDGFECMSSYEDSAASVGAKVSQLCDCIDAELQESDPWMEMAE